MVAVDATSGSCLGLVGGDVWSRDGINPTPHRHRPLAERESVRWINTAQQAKSVLTSAAMVTVVADREADIYPAWGAVPEANFHMLGRAMSDRSWPVAARCLPRRRSSRRRDGAQLNCGHMIPLTPSALP
jgi:hypothetical protein